MKTRRKWLWLVAAGLKPGTLLACAACYGQSDSPMAEGMNWGILSLLGIVLVVLGGIAVSFVSLARKASALEGSVRHKEGA